MEKFKIDGDAELQEVYRNEKDKTYGARLDITIHSEKYYSQHFKIEVPIAEEQYNRLKEKILNSTAERPILHVKGSLEFFLDSVCFN